MNLRERIEHDFSYHAPRNHTEELLHESTRADFRNLALWLEDRLPTCRETSLALTKLEEAMMWANAAIARNKDVQG